MAIEACQADLLKTLKNKINYLTEHKNMKLTLRQHPSLTMLLFQQHPIISYLITNYQAVFCNTCGSIRDVELETESQDLKFFRVQNKFKLLKEKKKHNLEGKLTSNMIKFPCL